MSSPTIEKIVKSFNVFVDSDRGEASNSKGDEYTLELNNVSVDAARNQYMRLNLQSFNMHKVWSNVNEYNDTFVLITNHSSGQVRKKLKLTNKNYISINDLVEDFAEQVRVELLRQVKDVHGTHDAVELNTTTDPLAPAASSAGGTSDFVLSFQLDFKLTGTLTPHGLGQVLVQFYDKYDGQVMDTYSLLGGNRIRENGVGDDDNTNTNNTDSISVNSTIDSHKSIKFLGLYHCQRMSEAYVYLRLENVNHDNLATTSLESATNTERNNRVHHSTILGRITMSDEFITYQASHEREYFVDIQQKHLTNIKLRLTDSHGNKLPADPNRNQATQGNLNFSAVLRVDIVQKYDLNDQNSGLQNQNMPRRFNNLILSEGGHNQQL